MMEHSEKVTLTKTSRDRLGNILNIMLELARINAFDANGNILGNKGVISNSDLLELLMYISMSSDIPKGKEDFIKLLNMAGIQRNMINNENVKEKIQETRKTYTFNAPSVPNTPEQIRVFSDEIQNETQMYAQRQTPPSKREIGKVSNAIATVPKRSVKLQKPIKQLSPEPAKVVDAMETVLKRSARLRKPPKRLSPDYQKGKATRSLKSNKSKITWELPKDV